MEEDAYVSWSGGSFGARGYCVLAPNPSPMTLDGTNTWVLHEPGGSRSVVVDPGPLEEGHLRRVREVAGDVATVLLTHGHADHSAAARTFADRVGCGVRALDPSFRYGGEGLHDGDVLDVDGLQISVVATPGHTSDSLSFFIPAEGALLTGDTVLGRGTTVVAHPDGALGPYLNSLRRLRDLAEAANASALWPGHGPALSSVLPVIDGYITHRQERLEQVRRARAAGLAEPAEVVRRVYADVDPALWPAAELSVRAQLDYLREHEG